MWPDRQWGPEVAEPETPDAGTRLRVARARYEKAIAEMRRAESVYSDPGGQHPDGAAALRNANRQLGIASEEFRTALHDFSDEVLGNSRELRRKSSD